jgi:hypothetical protein
MELRSSKSTAIKVETDGHGNVIAYPVTDWELRNIANMSLLAVIQYVEFPDQLESGERKQLQALMNPAQALELAEALKVGATLLLTPEDGITLQ